ncbi:hypothetical protein G9A89_017901 [Geosiphon pyriformis]|nr:hypothetical protein G9A89_017901 [Geosiphon pyriformis]
MGDKENSNFDGSICNNLTFFKDLMKEYRKIDDNIMIRLNTTDTHSVTSCEDLFKQLAGAYTKREKAIKSCLKILDEELSQKLKALEDDPFDSVIKSQVFVSESKRRMIANEMSVEEIVRERSLNGQYSKKRETTKKHKYAEKKSFDLNVINQRLRAIFPRYQTIQGRVNVQNPALHGIILSDHSLWRRLFSILADMTNSLFSINF